MNIFVLDENPEKAVAFMCDKHVVKMILESAQMLCTAHRILDDRQDDILYKATHKAHPCTIWVMESRANYRWLYEHFKALCLEYEYRYEKIHLTKKKLLDILYHPPKNMGDHEFSGFVAVMPDEFIKKDIVASYRLYYQSKLKEIDMRWTKRSEPKWL